MKGGLISSFFRYMESTRHLVLYRLDSNHSIPSTLFMPYVDTLTLIDCKPDMISSILYRHYFPHLQRIHYLSLPPSDTEIHKRFTNIGFLGWTFPIISQPYPFYDHMTEAGFGRKDNGLITNYIACHRPCSSKSVFDLYLPQRGIVSGQFYIDQQQLFFKKKQCDEFRLPYPIRSEKNTLTESIPPHFTTHATHDSRWVYQQECLNRVFEKYVLNLPDAIPYHSSNK